MSDTTIAHPRELVRPCRCGQPVIRYVTSEGTKAAPYCRDCAPGGSAGH